MTVWKSRVDAFRAQGGDWVVAQLMLLLLVVLVPLWTARPPATLPLQLSLAGWLLIGLGLVFALLAVHSLGSALTPLPKPVDKARLRDQGIYALVRHPMYAGVWCLALGWVLLQQSAPGMLLVVALFVFFDRKAAHEEVWLLEKFPEYADYRARVKKMIPGIY